MSDPTEALERVLARMPADPHRQARAILADPGPLLAALAEAGVLTSRADVWDEGFTRGFYDHLAGGSHDASESDATNPYAEEARR